MSFKGTQTSSQMPLSVFCRAVSVGQYPPRRKLHATFFISTLPFMYNRSRQLQWRHYAFYGNCTQIWIWFESACWITWLKVCLSLERSILERLAFQTLAGVIIRAILTIHHETSVKSPLGNFQLMLWSTCPKL